VQLERIAENEIVDDDQHCTDDRHDERFVGKGSLCFINRPDAISE
jgi:hypothetical protein